MGDATGISSIVQLLLGGGGALVLTVYALWAGMHGRWMFGSVHDKIVQQYETLLTEANAKIAFERERGDKWQNLYIESRHIIDKSTSITADVIQNVPMTSAGEK